MIYFNNDYSEGCHEKVLEALVKTNMVQTLGYGEDVRINCFNSSREIPIS